MMFCYIYRFLITVPSPDLVCDPDDSNTVEICVNASDRSEADEKLKIFLSEDFKLYKVVRFDEDEDVFYEEELKI